MSVATRSINSPALQASLEPLAVRIARAATITVLESLPSEVIDKTKICLLDLIGGAFEARGLPQYCAISRWAELVEAHSPFDRLRANELKRTALRPAVESPSGGAGTRRAQWARTRLWDSTSGRTAD